MKLLTAGAPVSPSRVTDVFTAYGIAPASGPRCWQNAAEVLPFAGLLRTRAFAATPTSGSSAGDVSPQGVVVGRPFGMTPRKRQQHIDLDPQRPRPSGGCG